MNQSANINIIKNITKETVNTNWSGGSIEEEVIALYKN
jgi:hypothetical protein